MSLSNLNDEEKNVLLQLSYFDLPGDLTGLTVKEIWEEAMRTPSNGGEARRIKLEEYFTSDTYKNSRLAEVTLQGYQNNNPTMGGESESGFVGYAWGDKTGNAAAVYRGSEDPTNWDHFKTDWVSNGSAGIGNEIQQQKEANHFYEEFVKGATGEKLIVGHSKGGNLASYVFVNNIADKPSGYVVNGAPLFWPSLTEEQQEALKSIKFDFIAYEGDFVHDLGFAPYVDKTVAINKDDYDDPFYPHYETSVDFANGSFEKSQEGSIFSPNDINTEAIKFAIVNAVNGVREAYKAALAITNSALMVIHATWKGMQDAANLVIDSCVALVRGFENVSVKAIIDLRNFFDSVRNHTRFLLNRRGGAASGGSFPVEPYLQVNLQRLAYYAERLQVIKRKTNSLNSRIDDLYFEAGLFGLDNVLKADMLTTFNGTINQNITYLNTVKNLLERTESILGTKARSIQ
ncbi:Mbeg1-like protein [Neobacillus sp. NPDC093182]|uniref:Mbeg1-like protein n=1 Tax=Neobacillus sp. NPDC093182 TaxID=3364297 RepID=UPI0038090B16